MRSPVVRVGLAYGLLSAVIAVGMQIALGVTNVNQVLFEGAETVIRVTSYVASLVLYLLAGRAAAAMTGKTSSGVLAGLVAGVISGLAVTIVALVFFSPVGKVPYDLLIQVLVIVASVEVLAFDVGLGVGGGAIGGLLGRRAHRHVGI